MNEQQAYDLGYANPSTPLRELMAMHPKDGTIYPWHQGKVNALFHGQADYQNQTPHNRNYRREDYDQVTGERLPPPIVDGGAS